MVVHRLAAATPAATERDFAKPRRSILNTSFDHPPSPRRVGARDAVHYTQHLLHVEGIFFVNRVESRWADSGGRTMAVVSCGAIHS
jgi:hypothetical protein